MAYDLVIIGAASSVATLTARLSEDRDTTVLLLEAGSDDHTANTPRWRQVPNLFGVIASPEFGHFRYDGLTARRSWLPGGSGALSARRSTLDCHQSTCDQPSWQEQQSETATRNSRSVNAPFVSHFANRIRSNESDRAAIRNVKRAVGPPFTGRMAAWSATRRGFVADTTTSDWRLTEFFERDMLHGAYLRGIFIRKRREIRDLAMTGDEST
jgi:choline dehydrogenase-like flavoprotein